MKNEDYKNNIYWQTHKNFHEEDGLFKANNCYKLVKKLKINNIQTVLDVGCGSGSFVFEFSKFLKAKYFGIDVSSDAIIRANKKFSNNNIKFSNASIHEVDKIFDLIILNDVVEHVPDVYDFLNQINKKGKYFYFNIPIEINILSTILDSHIKTRKKFGHIHYFSKKTALALLEDCKFKIIDSQFNSNVLHAFSTNLTIGSTILFLPRLITFFINPGISVKLFNGASLGVLCKK